MRRGELAGMKWDHIDLDLGAIYVLSSLERVSGVGLTVVPTKTARSRRVWQSQAKWLIYLGAIVLARPNNGCWQDRPGWKAIGFLRGQMGAPSILTK